MKRYLTMGMILGLIAGVATTAGAEQRVAKPVERTVEEGYGPVPEIQCNAAWVSLACVAVDAHPTEHSFSAKVKDAHGQPVFVQVVTDDGGRVATFCGETAEPVSFDAGSGLEFLIEPTPYFWSHWGVEWVGPLDCPYRVATTGSISVTFFGGTSEEPTSPPPAPAESPAPQPSASDQPAAVERSLDLALRHHLRGSGSVVAADASCSSDVPVVIQRKRFENWLDVASTTTDGDGAFALRLPDRSGRYRAIAFEARSPEATCLAAKSATVRHQH